MLFIHSAFFKGEWKGAQCLTKHFLQAVQYLLLIYNPLYLAKMIFPSHFAAMYSSRSQLVTTFCPRGSCFSLVLYIVVKCLGIYKMEDTKCEKSWSSLKLLRNFHFVLVRAFHSHFTTELIEMSSILSIEEKVHQIYLNGITHPKILYNLPGWDLLPVNTKFFF